MAEKLNLPEPEHVGPSSPISTAYLITRMIINHPVPALFIGGLSVTGAYEASTTVVALRFLQSGGTWDELVHLMGW